MRTSMSILRTSGNRVVTNYSFLPFYKRMLALRRNNTTWVNEYTRIKCMICLRIRRMKHGFQQFDSAAFRCQRKTGLNLTKVLSRIAEWIYVELELDMAACLCLRGNWLYRGALCQYECSTCRLPPEMAQLKLGIHSDVQIRKETSYISLRRKPAACSIAWSHNRLM